MGADPSIHWTEEGEARTALWRSQGGIAAPVRVRVVDDRLTADEAYGLACQGTALLWRGDFQNARQMLKALANRADAAWRKRKSSSAVDSGAPSPAAFHLYRQGRAHRARTLGRLLLPLEPDFRVPLRRAPDVRQACIEVYGPGDVASVVSLRELLGVVGAHEWRHRGIDIEAIGGRIHPHYGVFAPVRREYVDLVADAPLASASGPGSVAFDIGTGTGVLAAVLARRGIGRVVATDLDPRAFACARENIARLGLADRVEVIEADLFPPGRAALVVCNPPWIPARPSSPLEQGIYDPGGRLLQRFLALLPAHLERDGEGWLVLSDLAEHLGLRSRSELLAAIERAGLEVRGRLDARPGHPRAADSSDDLHAARAAETTSIWRLGLRGSPQPVPETGNEACSSERS